MRTSDADFDRFICAITGANADCIESILSDYIDLLACRFATIAANAEAGGRHRLLRLLDQRATIGIATALCWPAVSRVLLGRSPGGRPVDEILVSIPATVASPSPTVLVDARWLDAVRGEHCWQPDSDSTARIGEALAMLESEFPHWHALVRLCTRIICPVQADGTVFGSWSTDELIGCSIIVNGRRSGHLSNLCEQLVHESVHHCQGMVDAGRPFIVRPDVLAPMQCRSPWTGRLLTPKGLVGATFVWFTLTRFWTDMLAVTGSQVAEEGLQRAVAGFKGETLDTYFGAFGEAIDPEIPKLVRGMRTMVLAGH